MVYGLSPDQPSCDDLAAYAEWLLQGGLASQTVRNHFGAIKALYVWVDNKQAVDILNSAAWQLSIKGIVNTVRPSYNILAAMIPDDLVAMVEAAASSLELAPLMVVLTFGFIGYLRVSNMAPPKASEFDPSRHTTVGDVFLRNEGLVLSLKWSKLRQRTKLPVAIPLPCLGSTLLCPLRAWRSYNNYLTAVNITVSPSSPLLLTTQQPAGRPVTIPMIRSMFKTATRLAHVEDAGYTPHSLRRGGATFSYHAGVPISNIKLHGTWRSDAVNNYLASQPLSSSPVAHNFVKLLTNYEYTSLANW